MSESLSEAEAWLLELVRSGDRDGWTQLVDRYQGRLLAFARSQLPQSADADDVVQEAFLSFLKSLPTYRASASLETWLFQLLRRRIADHYRRSGSKNALTVCSAFEAGGPASSHAATRPDVRVDQSASWYARRTEQQQLDYQSVSIGVLSAVERLKSERQFTDLKIFDLLFLAHWRNKVVAETLSLDEKSIALKKYRFIQKVASDLDTSAINGDAAENDAPLAGLLTELWQDWRPSCPKRTTLGKYLLETLDEEWDDYLQFHLETLGCRYCAANLDDLDSVATEPDSNPLRDRIMQSTVGFLNREASPGGSAP